MLGLIFGLSVGAIVEGVEVGLSDGLLDEGIEVVHGIIVGKMEGSSEDKP